MKHKFFKKIVAGAITIAMAAQFAVAMPVSANAELLYSQDYEAVTDASTVMTSTSAQGQVVLKTDKTKYLAFDFSGTSTNSRGSESPFTGVDTSGLGQYIIEFDSVLNAGTNQDSNMCIKGTDFVGGINDAATSGWVFNMVTTNSTIWTINGTKTVDIPKNAWCHFKLYVDKDQGLVSTTITNGDTVLMDKVPSAYNGKGDVAGIHTRAGRYNPYFAWDNIIVRHVGAGDEFGVLQPEVLSSLTFTNTPPRSIPQPELGTSNDYTLTVKALGDRLGDLTKGATVAWSFKGLDNEDGYVTITENGDNANINVRNGVSNYYVVATATVTYEGKELSISYPFAIIGAGTKSDNQIIPNPGYPTDMNAYPDSLVGYKATANGQKDSDVILNNWAIYGSNGAKTLSLVKNGDTKALEFASNGGGGSTIGVYQWPEIASQYIIDMDVKFTADMSFGVWGVSTPNDTKAVAQATFSYGSGAINAGTGSIPGVSANDWYRVVMSADPSANLYSVMVYDKQGEFIGSIDDMPLVGKTVGQFLCFNGTYPVYLKRIEAYTPSISTMRVDSSTDVVKVPESGEAAQTVELSAALADANGVKLTGAVEWSLAEEYANVELTSTGAQTAVLNVNEGASGAITVIATRDGKTAEKTINLTTSSNVVAFTSSAASITIPFAGEENIVANFVAETRDGAGTPIDGGEITYTLLAKDGVTETTVKGVTFDNGVMTVLSSATPAVVYVKATNQEGLSTKVKVNIHGLSFAFGSQEPEEGYTHVTDTQYTEKLGYGFTKTSGLTINEASVSSAEKFTFKANVPNGNYVVNVATTAENMTSEIVENVTASTGIYKAGSSFKVAVCDGVLDLTFNIGTTVTNPEVSTITISQDTVKAPLEKPAIYAIGDSTTNTANDGNYSWGNCVASKYVAVPDVFTGFSNHGMAGRDSVNYYNQGRVEAVLLSICPGDYVTVNMGINSKETNEGASFYTLMSEYYVKGIIQRGAIPVIVTATPQGPVGNYVGNYNAQTGKFTCNRGDGAQNKALRQIAKEQGLNIIELGQFGDDFFNSLTMDDVNAYNAEKGTAFNSVLELVQSWYGDHNHYRQYLGEVLGTYILGQVEKIYTSIEITPTVTNIDASTAGTITVSFEGAEGINATVYVKNTENVVTMGSKVFDESTGTISVVYEGDLKEVYVWGTDSLKPYCEKKDYLIRN